MLFQKLRRIPKLYCERFSLELLSVAEIAPVKVVHWNLSPRSLSHLYNRFSINKSVMKGCDTSTETAPIICDSLD